MWSEIFTIVSGTVAMTGGYFGIYQLGWYVSHREQINNMLIMLDRLKENHEENNQIIKNYEEHIDKLQHHTIKK